MADIGLSGLLLDSPYSGTATYTRQLARHLPDVAPDLSFQLYARAVHPDLPTPSRRITTPFDTTRRSRLGARLDKLTWETASLPAASAFSHDLLLHSLYFAAPPLAASRVVVTIHDLIPMAMPGHYRGRWPELYTRFMAWTARRAAAIITVSQHSRRDIVRLLAVPAERVHVTPEAADERFSPRGSVSLPARYGLPQRFLLYLGGAERRKNVETLVRAYARSAVRRDGMPLVLVANFPPADSLYPDIPRLLRELDLEREVISIPEVAEADKPTLYRAATVFCYPSRYEGFGLPPLEAMASGTPVLAANATSLPEVLGDAAWLLPPDDIDAWTDAIDQTVGDQVRRMLLAERGVVRAAGYTWRQTAAATAAVYRSLL